MIFKKEIAKNFEIIITVINKIMTSNIIDRARASGKCSPSLLRDDTDNDFNAAVVKVVDANGTYFLAHVHVHVFLGCGEFKTVASRNC